MSKLDSTIASDWHPAWESRTPIQRPVNLADSSVRTGWIPVVRVLFRFFFLYFTLQALPLDWRFYRDLLTLDWGSGFYRDLFNLSRYAPRFFGNGIAADTFADWAIIAQIALLGTLIWSWQAKKRANYDGLYYVLRVVLRYRLAFGVLAYGFIKLFPLQAPYPSISNLNTAYGDFTAWKLFSLSLGVVPSYESFLGLVEIVGGLLLLNRRTTPIGLLLILPFLGNVFVSNLAYEGGEHIYSLLLITFALALFAFDAMRLFRLVSLEVAAAPARFRPVFTGWQRAARLVVKTAFVVLMVGVYGYKTYAAYRTGPYQFPQSAGLPGAAGIYNVTEFRLRGQTIPYARQDSVRWQDVVFETWNTISVKSNRPVKLDAQNTEEIHTADTDRTYEQAGSQGRHYYQYQIDSTRHVLTLTNRNPNHAGETLHLHYDRPTPQRITLSGLNEDRDSVYVVLEKRAKKYLIDEAAKAGRRGALTL
ncbi:DoxX family protein [uncultured Spirosoma sp.]|uniref:DoxX family protein n=1 Tax=uncultured Spirosoma sp. TaxID=278208 RepID=UPI00258BB64D|nr:DoxX family protein [uncultured Spirosoma sp.]